MEVPEKDQPVIKTEYNGSDLYDSFELREMTYQLNKAMIKASNNALSPTYQEMKYLQLNKAINGGSNPSSPAFVFHLNSPFYRRHLNRIYKESANTPRRISRPQSVADKKVGSRRGIRARSFVSRLWMKVKQGLLLGNKNQET